MLLGGLTFEEKNSLEKLLNDELKNKDEFNKRFKNFLENNIAFYLNIALFKKGIDQVKSEMPLIFENQLIEMNAYLKSEQLDSAIKDLSKKNPKIEIVHNLNAKDNEYLIKKYQEKTDWNRLVTNFKNNLNKSNVKLSELREKLISSENKEKFEYYLKEIKIVENNLNTLNHAKTELEFRISNQKIKAEELHLQFESLNTVLKKSYSYDNSFILSMQAININKNFINYLVKSNKQKVSDLATIKFNEVMRKQNFVSKIVIGELFDLHLFDKSGKEIESQILSAGEKQLLVSSLIFSMVKISKRNLFFVFDTPLARLDKQNRKNFINVIISQISKQSIILSTDSEFVDECFNLISMSITKKYKLEYIDEFRSTKVDEGYFVENKS